MPGARDYKGADLAPYKRFRKARFYGGCFTVDVQNCNWACDNCWSQMGWKGQDPTYELDSDEVVKRIVRGLDRNHVSMARVSGGEPTLNWDGHMRLVAQKFVEQTEGTLPDGDEEPFLVIETNGTILKPAQVERFEAEMLQEADRLQLTIGLKATSAELLAKLTGHSLKTAERFRKAQMELVEFMAAPERIVELDIVMLDAFCTDEGLDELEDWLDGIRQEGRGFVDIQQFKTSGWGSQKHTTAKYTPKRHRGKTSGSGK